LSQALLKHLAPILLAALLAAPATAQSGAIHPLTTVDEVVDAVAVCMAASTSKYVNLGTLAASGWKIGQVFGDASEMAINNCNKPGSNADVMIITVAPNPGSLQCSAIGRFPSDGSFADLDRALETLFARPPDRRGTDTQDTGEMTAQSFWNLEHNSVEALHFFGRNSVMIVVRFQ